MVRWERSEPETVITPCSVRIAVVIDAAHASPSMRAVIWPPSGVGSAASLPHAARVRTTALAVVLHRGGERIGLSPRSGARGARVASRRSRHPWRGGSGGPPVSHRTPASHKDGGGTGRDRKSVA